MEKPPIECRTSEEELRRIFNEGRYWERAQAGEFTTIVIEEYTPNHISEDTPLGSRGQMVSYRDKTTDDEIVRVHQYLRPDGSIGGKGRPDPKILLHEGVLYLQLSKKKKS